MGKRPFKADLSHSDVDSDYPDSEEEKAAASRDAVQEGQGDNEFQRYLSSLPANRSGASGAGASASAAGNKTTVTPKVVLAVKQQDILGMVMYMSNGSDTYAYLKNEARKRCHGRTSHEIGQQVAKFQKGVGLQQRKVNRKGDGWKDWHMTDMARYAMPVRELKEMYESGGKMWFDIDGPPPCVDPEMREKFEADMQKLIPDFTLDQIRVMEVESD